MYGSRIRELRKRRGWTMKQLGQQLELAESTISGYENEIRRPDMESLLRFAEIFEVSVDYLLGREGANPLGGRRQPNMLRETQSPYYVAIWDGVVESLTEEE